ncbi:MAG: HD domain-containing protein [Methanosarcinales archaeon]|nr:HD domain-containing protein [Methanosarcinales archaeon]
METKEVINPPPGSGGKGMQIRESAIKIFDGAANAGHDINHSLRVMDLCAHICNIEGGDNEILEAAALLHDIGRCAQLKDPAVDHATLSAQLAPDILSNAGFPSQKVPAVVYAIKHHRYSSGLTPDTLEARILQDADRLDISGALGVAMTFTYSGAMNRKLYHSSDPLAGHRQLDGDKYALDHILSKLIQLPRSMHTVTARLMAEERNRFLNGFVEQLVNEITFTRRQANE